MVSDMSVLNVIFEVSKCISFVLILISSTGDAEDCRNNMLHTKYPCNL